jgi:hypothetical protein
MDALLGFAATLAVSAAAGLNAYVPLLLLGILSRTTDLVTLASPWDRLEEPWVLAAIGGVAVLDFVGDKLPAIDHALHVVGTAIAPIAGGGAALATAGPLDVDPEVAAILGMTAALATHVGRSAARPASTVVTAGAGNPALSLAEDVTSGVLTVLAFAAPLVALMLVIAILAGIFWGIRRWRALGRRLEIRRDRLRVGDGS